MSHTTTRTNGFKIRLRRLVNTYLKYHLDEVTELLEAEAIRVLERNGVDVSDPDSIPDHVFEENKHTLLTHFFGKDYKKE